MSDDVILSLLVSILAFDQCNRAHMRRTFFLHLINEYQFVAWCFVKVIWLNTTNSQVLIVVPVGHLALLR